MIQRPSFLKRQKEQKRKAKADQKREARRARRQGSGQDENPAPEIDTPPAAVEKPTSAES
jgi:hypothetical protein